MKPTIRELSEVTGFSPATVSNALNRKRGVNQETARLVFKAAEEIGYLSNEKEMKIKFVMYKTNGMIIDDTPFFTMLLDGFQNECRRHGYEVIICYLDRRDVDFEKRVEELLGDSTAIVALLGTEIQEGDLHYFVNAQCTFLALDYWNKNMIFSGVLSNNEDAAVMAVDYLYQKGHRNIGYLRGSFRIQPFSYRALGYRSSLQDHGISYQSKYVVTLSTTMDGAYQDMKAYLKKKPEMPTAFFADNDVIALGAMKALKENGYPVPEKVSIIGFDDLPFCEIASPRLTSMRVPKQEMGAIAVRQLISMIGKENGAISKIQVCSSFIERDSVRDINETGE